MAQISARVRAALFARLSARFNDLLASVAADYGIQPFTIDFNSQPKSVNFFWGELDPEDIEGTTPNKPPLMTLYTKQSANQNLQKPSTFSGVIRMGSDVVLTWINGSANVNFELLGDAVEEVINTIVNEMAQLGWVITAGLDRSPIKRGQENWFQLLRFSFLFEVLQ